MWLHLLLTIQFWLMSDRDSFSNSDQISFQTEMKQDITKKRENFNPKIISGKNILVLVHGYNNDFEKACATYRIIYDHISEYVQRYDLIIGYLWPGNDSILEYFDAKRNAAKLAKKMRSHLEFLSKTAAQMDILAHSMGNFLVFEALNYISFQNKRIVHNFYALAPAIDNESIEKKEKYTYSTQNCEKIYVFYSQRDAVLKWFYTIAEWDKALGYEGAEQIRKLPQNVSLINFTNFVAEHGQYFTALPLYEFMKKTTMK